MYKQIPFTLDNTAATIKSLPAVFTYLLFHILKHTYSENISLLWRCSCLDTQQRS